MHCDDNHKFLIKIAHLIHNPVIASMFKNFKKSTIPLTTNILHQIHLKKSVTKVI